MNVFTTISLDDFDHPHVEMMDQEPGEPSMMVVRMSHNTSIMGSPDTIVRWAEEIAFKAKMGAT